MFSVLGSSQVHWVIPAIVNLSLPSLSLRLLRIVLLHYAVLYGLLWITVFYSGHFDAFWERLHFILLPSYFLKVHAIFSHPKNSGYV